MTPSQTLKRAAQLLDEDAQAGLESCQVGDKPWACTDCSRLEGRCLAKIAHDDRRKVAVELRLLGEAFV